MEQITQADKLQARISRIDQLITAAEQAIADSQARIKKLTAEKVGLEKELMLCLGDSQAPVDELTAQADAQASENPPPLKPAGRPQERE